MPIKTGCIKILLILDAELLMMSFVIPNFMLIAAWCLDPLLVLPFEPLVFLPFDPLMFFPLETLVFHPFEPLVFLSFERMVFLLYEPLLLLRHEPMAFFPYEPMVFLPFEPLVFLPFEHMVFLPFQPLVFLPFQPMAFLHFEVLLFFSLPDSFWLQCGFVMVNLGLKGSAEDLGLHCANSWFIPAEEGDMFAALDKFWQDPVNEENIPMMISFPSMKDHLQQNATSHTCQVRCQETVGPVRMTHGMLAHGCTCDEAKRKKRSSKEIDHGVTNCLCRHQICHDLGRALIDDTCSCCFFVRC